MVTGVSGSSSLSGAGSLDFSCLSSCASSAGAGVTGSAAGVSGAVVFSGVLASTGAGAVVCVSVTTAAGAGSCAGACVSTAAGVSCGSAAFSSAKTPVPGMSTMVSMQTTVIQAVNLRFIYASPPSSVSGQPVAFVALSPLLRLWTACASRSMMTFTF